MAIRLIRNFIQTEGASGFLLFFAALLALAFANSPWASVYTTLISTPIIVANFHFSFLDFINEALMSLFFLLVSLEIKRECMEGELNSRKKAILPLIAAVGGMLAPALIYIICNFYDAQLLKAWAIPCATDIAFSLGVLLILGSRIPHALKIFLTALAIIDDLGAIIIIALYYTEQFFILYFCLAAILFLLLIICNLLDIRNKGVYALLGILLWFAVLHTGIHATLAGVLLGLSIPLGKEAKNSLLKNMEQALNPWVAFAILPLFAFANAGFSLQSFDVSMLMHSLPLGITLGLFFGKQLGIFGFAYAAVKMKLAHLPYKVTWAHFYGMSVICGIGFTMSLFIGTLSFEDEALLALMKLGVMLGSLLSILFGVLILSMSARKNDV